MLSGISKERIYDKLIMKKRIGLIICILIVLISAGCWNKKEPKDLAIVNSIIYNKTQDGTYEVTVEILDLTGSGKKSGTGGGGGEGSSKNFTTETARGSSYREALANVSTSIEKSIYGGHNHIRFFTESAAKDDMAATIDYLLRDHLTDETPLMVVIKGDEPDKIYESAIGLSDSVGVFIDSMEVTQQKTSSRSVFVTTLDFTRDFFNDGKEPVAGVVQVVKSKPEKQDTKTSSSQEGEDKERILYEGLAAFKGDKLVGFYDGAETCAYNFITGKIGVAVLTVPYKDAAAVCEIAKASTDIKTKIDGETASVDVKIKAQIRVIGFGADEDPSDPETMKKIENEFNQNLLPQIAAVIEKAQKEFRSDIFGFGQKVHAQNPEDWKRIKEQWDQIFPTATVTISVESEVVQTSETKDSVLSEFSEE